ncbi:LCP family protein [Streptomyces sp. NPDC003023]|uniref:LCP family protein n=1 Tax=Streptomyces sp. NPDC003023 TaxID=3364675 RepID=UPI0036A7D2A7
MTDKAGTRPAGSAGADESARSAGADESAGSGDLAATGSADRTDGRSADAVGTAEPGGPAGADADLVPTGAGSPNGASRGPRGAGRTGDDPADARSAAADRTAGHIGDDVTDDELPDAGRDSATSRIGPDVRADTAGERTDGTPHADADDAEGVEGTGGDAGPGPADGHVPGEGRGGADDGASGREDGPRNGRGDGRGSGGGSGGDGSGDDPSGGGERRPRHWMRWAALGTSLVVLAAAGAGWWFYRKLDSNITTDTTAAAELETYEKERPTPLAVDAQNILLLGSDTRSGEGNDEYGRDEGGGSQRSDTTILLHIAADHESATAMSIPRDLMVTVPSCGKPDGSRTEEQMAQFNSAFQLGGAACTIRTVEKFTGIRVDHHMVIDFRGFKDMVDAVDGVEVCLKEPIDDKAARLKLPAGPQTLHGEQALGFVRARKTLGNGSDTERMERQQQFLGALVKKVQSNGVLLNPTRLYPVLDAATKSITTDPGLDSLRDLYDLTRSIRSIPTEKVQFLTVPRKPHSANPNRDELVQPEADQLFKSLREDASVTVVPGDEQERDGATGEPDADGTTGPSPTPTFPGTNAAEGMCE